MPASVLLYNQTSRLFLDCSNSPYDSYMLMLCTALTFDATNAILSDVTRTETPGLYGYTSGGQELQNVEIITSGTNGAKFDANDLLWSAVGGNITASYGLLYNNSSYNYNVIAAIDFGGSQVALDGSDFSLVWNPSGIIAWTVA